MTLPITRANIKQRLAILLGLAVFPGPLSYLVAVVLQGSWQAPISVGTLLFCFLACLALSAVVMYYVFRSYFMSFNEVLSEETAPLEERMDELEGASSAPDNDSEHLRSVLRKASPVIRKASRHIKGQHQKIIRQNRHLAQKNAELIENIQRVTQACEAADRANADKDNFIANISHELRTPLSGVVAAVEMIEQTVAQGIAKMLTMDRSKMSPAQVKALRDSRQEVREILTIIDEILKPSSTSMEIMVDDLLESLRDISYSDIKLHPVPFSLEKVFSGTAKAFEDNAFRKGLIFDYKLINHVRDTDQFYRGDWVRIGQVINSLLGNAIRFTEQGGVTLTAEVSPTRTAGAHRIRFEVEDTGCGISSEEALRIFNLFHIGEDPTKKTHSGLGIGLTIAQTIAKKLGGKVELARSVVGEGSTFVFELSLETSAEADENVEKQDSPNQLSLLYVEDSKVNRSIFKQFCDRSNIDLQMAVDGKDGWDKYMRNRYDALVIDCFMPNKNGFELVEEIRAHERQNGLPRALIFALTADPTNMNKKRCIKAGFDEFLTKPYRRATFNFIIEKSNNAKSSVVRVQEKSKF